MARDHTLPWQVVTTTDESLLTSSPTATVWRQEDPDSTQMHVVSCYGPFPGEIPVPSAVALKSWLGTRWAEMALIFISEDTETPGGTPTVWSPPTICSWGPPRLDVFFMTTADGFGDGLGITHGWNENADPSAGWGWETFALPS